MARASSASFGAGGIGQEDLYRDLKFNYYEEVSAIVLMVIVAVALIDLVGERLRHSHHRGGRRALRWRSRASRSPALSGTRRCAFGRPPLERAALRAGRVALFVRLARVGVLAVRHHAAADLEWAWGTLAPFSC